MLAKSFGYVTGLKYHSFNVIKVLKTSQCNGKDNAKIKYCRRVAGRILTIRAVTKALIYRGEWIFIYSRSARRISFEISCHYS